TAASSRRSPEESYLYSPVYGVCIIMKINWLKLRGGSMRPVLKEGDIVPVNEDKKDYHSGDVVAYRIKDKNYIHRILKREGEYYLMKDDANLSDGHWVGKSDIMGKVDGGLFSGTAGRIWGLFIRKFYYLARKIKKIFIKA
ncbi:S24/S26 family peptidase, partial [Elusimicrobiota bacterium]